MATGEMDRKYNIYRNETVVTTTAWCVMIKDWLIFKV